MKFNIGDRVRFLNDVGGGKVVKFIDNETVAVLNEDDFEIPVLISELILDEAINYEKSKSSGSVSSSLSKGKATIQQEEIIEDGYVKEDDTIAIFLAFVPKDQQNRTDSALILHLINDSNYHVYANVLLQYGAFHVSHPKNMQPNIKLELKTIAKDEINDVDTISVQLMFYKNEPHKLQPVISKEIKIKPMLFFKDSTFTENDFFDEKAHLLTVYDENKTENKFPEISAEELKKAMQTKEYENKIVNKKPESKSSKPKEEREVDLHIHELLDHFENMSAQEILDYQMEAFRREMQRAVQEKVRKIVFIHGKGNGALKSELRRELKHKYRKYQFQDASFQQYGFGATMVYIH